MSVFSLFTLSVCSHTVMEMISQTIFVLDVKCGLKKDLVDLDFKIHLWHSLCKINYCETECAVRGKGNFQRATELAHSLSKKP